MEIFIIINWRNIQQGCIHAGIPVLQVHVNAAKPWQNLHVIPSLS